MSDQELTDERVYRILSRLRPSMKELLKMQDILPYLKAKCVLLDAELQHLSKGGLGAHGRAARLVDYLMNRGSFGVGALYLCLVDSSEELSGLPTHHQLAVELRQIGITVLYN